MSWIQIGFIAYGISVIYNKLLQNATSVLLRILRNKLNFKPFNCVFCMAIWLSALAVGLTYSGSVKYSITSFLTAAGLTVFLNKLTGY